MSNYVLIFRHFATYAFGAIVIRGISFCILPFMMQVIPPAEYGIFSLLTTFTIIATAIIGLGLRQVLSIEYFHAQHSMQDRIIHDVVVIYTLFAVPTIALLWYCRSWMIQFFFFNTITLPQLAAILITTFLFFYSELLYQLLQYKQAARHLTLLQCSLALCIASMSIFGVLYVRLGISGMLWAQTIGTGIAASCSLIYLFSYHLSWQTLSVRSPNIYYYVQYGLPFIPGTLASWVMASADRWLLGYFMTMHEVGIYAVADLASQLFAVLILQPWAGSYLPYIMQQYQQQSHHITNVEQENERMMWKTILSIACIITASYPVGYLIALQLLPPIYRQALQYIAILLLGQIFLLGSYFAAALIQYKKHTYFLAGALCISAIANIILNVIFIPIGGIMGCAIATLISYGIYFIITYWFNKKILRTMI